MKKLSIEQKAKAYDEAIKRAKEFVSKDNVEVTEYIFPELAESEDERIRKELIKLLRNLFNNYSYFIKDPFYTECIAWLEKQGEQHPKFRIGDTIEKKSTGDIVTISEIDLKNREYRLSNTGFIPFKYENLWKLVEQKPTDKVKPKFHEGEWIITNKKHIWYVDETPETTSYLYRLINQYGKVEVAEFEVVDEKARLWTIQDAKDGDALATEPIEGFHSPFVAIYKKQNEEDFSSYCFIGFDGKFYKGEDGHITEGVHPATKEQRDLLFAKMKEAGYEWDADKKRVIF